MPLDLSLNYLPRLPRRKDFRIGCIGAGFIMRDCQSRGLPPGRVQPGGDQLAKSGARTKRRRVARHSALP